MKCPNARPSSTRTLPPSPLPNSHPNVFPADALNGSLLVSQRPRPLPLQPAKHQLMVALCWQRRRWLQRIHGPQLQQRPRPFHLEPSQPNKNQTKKMRVSMRMIHSAQLRDPPSRTPKIVISAPIVQVSPLCDLQGNLGGDLLQRASCGALRTRGPGGRKGRERARESRSDAYERRCARCAITHRRHCKNTVRKATLLGHERP